MRIGVGSPAGDPRALGGAVRVGMELVVSLINPPCAINCWLHG